MQTNMNSTLSPETRPNLNLLTKKENLPNIPSIYDSVMQPIETTQGTDKQLFFAPTNVSSDFGSAEQHLYFQNQSKINAANNEYSDCLGEITNPVPSLCLCTRCTKINTSSGDCLASPLEAFFGSFLECNQ